ncbi:hypothetical protein ACIRPP_09145 [Streptomyces sp. NPDC101219]|uniref:hypothetical protein n=1 Tax=Streptomyces sp. NPDC101219 TaxID=3366131 RepID=UPI003809C2A3
MTTQIQETERSTRSETGWARARRLRSEPPLRTCLPAVADRAESATPGRGAETNIVRGED